ncbi:hypothetical protein NSTCB13_00700 [Nostoc sp. DSM 114160]|jgi:hypothetical protein
MSTIVSRLDITQIFWDVDDFCNQWQSLWQQVPQLPSTLMRTSQSVQDAFIGSDDNSNRVSWQWL